MTIYYKDSFAGGTFERQQYIGKYYNKIWLSVRSNDTVGMIQDFLRGTYSKRTICGFLKKYSDERKYKLYYVTQYGPSKPITKVDYDG